MTRTDRVVAEFDPEPSHSGLLLVVERFANGVTFARVYTRDNHHTCLAHIRLDRPTSPPRTTQEPEQAEVDTHETEKASQDLEDTLAIFKTQWLTAIDDSERAEAMKELLQTWYDNWPTTAVTSPHMPLAFTLVDILGPWEADNNAGSSAPVDGISEKTQVSPGIGSPARVNSLRVEAAGKPHESSQFFDGPVQAVSFDFGPGDGPNLTVMFPVPLAEAVLAMADDADRDRFFDDINGYHLDQLARLATGLADRGIEAIGATSEQLVDAVLDRLREEPIIDQTLTNLAGRVKARHNEPGSDREAWELADRIGEYVRAYTHSRNELASLGVSAMTLTRERDDARAEVQRLHTVADRAADDAKTVVDGLRDQMAKVTRERDEASAAMAAPITPMRQPLADILDTHGIDDAEPLLADLLKVITRSVSGYIYSQWDELARLRTARDLADAELVSLAKVTRERDQAVADVTRFKTHLVQEQERLRGHLADARTDRDAAELAEVTRQREETEAEAGDVRRQLGDMTKLSHHLAVENARLRQALQAPQLREQPATGGLVLADRERELFELKGPCSHAHCGLHYAHSGPCNIRPVDPTACRPDETGLCHHPNHEH